MYRETVQNFERSRTVAQINQMNVARSLTQESVFVLERFVESIVTVASQSKEAKGNPIVQLFDEYWQHWQVIWGLESAVLYDSKGSSLGSWGEGEAKNSDIVLRVLLTEKPIHRVVCTNICFQQIVTPVLSPSGKLNVLSVSLSLLDTLLSYQHTINSDIGIINDQEKMNFSAVTHGKTNNQLWAAVRSKNQLQRLIDKSLNFKQGDRYYELRAFLVKTQQQGPYFVIINDLTDEYAYLENKFYYGVVLGTSGLLCAILFLLVSMHFSLSRVEQLSQALPLLAQQQYILFRKRINSSHKLFFTDELELLSRTAAQVGGQLESLQSDIQKKTDLLQKERDFSTQLINTAPMIIMTLNGEGRVLSINEEGMRGIGLAPKDITGQLFSELIPKSEIAHISQLNHLGAEGQQQKFCFNGRLINDSGQVIYIDWTHTYFQKTNMMQDAVVLSLGVNVTEKYLADQQLVWMATHDQLTGLSNRHYFQKTLENMLLAAERYHDKVALLYLDLDQFKVINDTCGHQAGDELLQSITEILIRETRTTDLLSRIGGDEFTLVSPMKNKKGGIEQLAKRLLQALKIMDYKVNGQVHVVSFSIGIAIYPDHGKTEQELLANADLAMYYAKKTGRSRYHIYSPTFSYQTILTEQLKWKNIIEKGIEEDRFLLYFQPILGIKEKKISHYECLLRLDQGDGTILMPGDFIGHAEETGIIDELERAVLKMAINQHLRFQKVGNNARLAINLSGKSMSNVDIFPYIESLMKQPGVKPELIIFEITETSAVSNFFLAKTLITQLKELGCHFALDDFGVGFSSFYYLKSLPVDYVKIDGSFVRHMDVNKEDRIFVKVLTEISQAFGKKIIAEFVENKEILNLLEDLGVEYAQGYYVSKPLSDPLDLSQVKGIEPATTLTLISQKQ